MTEQVANFCTIIGAAAGIIGIVDFGIKKRKPSLIVAIIGAALLLAVYLPKAPNDTISNTSGSSYGTTATVNGYSAGTSTRTATTNTYGNNAYEGSTAIKGTSNNSQKVEIVERPSVVTYRFSSESIQFPDTLKRDVYTGPDTSYFRAANGRAQFISDEFIYGGRIGNWMFVRCMVNSGGIRYGWINVGDYQSVIQRISPLQFSNANATIKYQTEIWDSLMDSKLGAIGHLNSGTQVTYLCDFIISNTTYAYVEASLSGVKVRGFVDPNAIQ